MGWCSGTETFDVAVGGILNEDNMTPKDRIKMLIQAWQNMDWDCEQDSQYWNHPVVRQAFKELWPDWFGDDEEC